MTLVSSQCGRERSAILTARLSHLMQMTDRELIPTQIVALAEELQTRLAARVRHDATGFCRADGAKRSYPSARKHPVDSSE